MFFFFFFQSLGDEIKLLKGTLNSNQPIGMSSFVRCRLSISRLNLTFCCSIFLCCQRYCRTCTIRVTVRIVHYTHIASLVKNIPGLGALGHPELPLDKSVMSVKFFNGISVAKLKLYTLLKHFKVYWPDCKPEGPLFSAEFVCLSLCLCVSGRHFYPSTLTDFDETWSQGPYCDLVWPRP